MVFDPSLARYRRTGSIDATSKSRAAFLLPPCAEGFWGVPCAHVCVCVCVCVEILNRYPFRSNLVPAILVFQQVEGFLSQVTASLG